MRKKVSIKPLSVNKAWQGRKFKTKDYKEYEKEFLKLLGNNKCINDFVEINYNIYIKNYKMSDVGNFEKPLSDIIVKSGIIKDDRFIKKITMEKFQSEKEFIEIIIEKYGKYIN